MLSGVLTNLKWVIGLTLHTLSEKSHLMSDLRRSLRWVSQQLSFGGPQLPFSELTKNWSLSVYQRSRSRCLGSLELLTENRWISENISHNGFANINLTVYLVDTNYSRARTTTEMSFLRLPYEIRYMIYELCLVVDHEIVPYPSIFQLNQQALLESKLGHRIKGLSRT